MAVEKGCAEYIDTDIITSTNKDTNTRQNIGIKQGIKQILLSSGPGC